MGESPGRTSKEVGPPPATPAWVKVFVTLAVVVVVLMVVMLATGGHHGPGRHI